jgi:hypothetical protein
MEIITANFTNVFEIYINMSKNVAAKHRAILYLPHTEHPSKFLPHFLVNKSLFSISGYPAKQLGDVAVSTLEYPNILRPFGVHCSLRRLINTLFTSQKPLILFITVSASLSLSLHNMMCHNNDH